MRFNISSMAPPSGETTQPDPMLSEELNKLNQRKSESRATFLGRAAGLVAEYPDTLLTEEDLATASDLLSNWQFSPGRLAGVMCVIALRAGSPEPPQKTMLDAYRVPEKRIVGITASNNIALLAKKAMDGSDLACIFEIEKAGAQYTPPKSKSLPPKRVKPPRKRPVPRKPKAVPSASPVAESGEPEPDVPKLKLDKDQADVLWHLPLHPAEIAYKLDIAEETIRTRITEAMNANDMNRQELLTRSVQENRIDLSLLPHPKTYTLTDREKEVLTQHSFASLAETAQAMSISKRVVSHTWGHIYDKLGASFSTRTDAFLIAKRDGVF